MNQFVRFILILGLLTAVAAGALAATNNLTADRIAEQVERAVQVALAAVVPDASSFEPLPEQLAALQAADPALLDVTALYRAMGPGGPVGYACGVTVTGYGGPVQLMVGVGDDGAISGLKVIQADKETPGLGAKIKSQSFQAQFAGKVATAPLTLVKVPTTEDSEVQAISAATISSSAVLRAVNAATGAYRAVAGSGEDRLAKLKEDAVKAMFPSADAVVTDPELLAQLIAANPDLSAAGGIHYAKEGEEIVGIAVDATGQGYGGPITAVAGFEAAARRIVGVALVDLPGETVGLGTKVAETAFTSQFAGKAAGQFVVVKATPGANEVQAVTGATRSSEGALAAVNAAVRLFLAMPGR